MAGSSPPSPRARRASRRASRAALGRALQEVLRRAALAGALALAALPAPAAAQAPDGEERLAQMRDLLERGYDAAAARLTGPSLVQERPDDPLAHRLYAEALYRTGDLEGARREADLAEELSGTVPEPELVRLDGLLRAAEGDLDGALRALENAFLRSRDYATAMDWGRVAWDGGRFETALEAFEAAANTPAGAREMWPRLDRGRILAALGRSDEAVVEFEAAIAVFDRYDAASAGLPPPGYAEAFYRIGRILEQQADAGGDGADDADLRARAEAAYRSALTADPNYAPATAALDALSRRPD